MNDVVSQKIESYFSQYPMRKYPKQQILIHAYEDPENVFYLVEGKVKQYDISRRGDEVVVNVFKPGAFFPMQWAITGMDNKFFFGSESAIEVRVVPVKDALQFLHDNEDVTYDLLRRLYMGVDGLLSKIVQLMAGNAQTRLLHELVTEIRRFGVTEDGYVHLKLSETELAARAGLTRETVSREMQKLTKANFVKVKHNDITIFNPEALEALYSADS